MESGVTLIREATAMPANLRIAKLLISIPGGLRRVYRAYRLIKDRDGTGVYRAYRLIKDRDGTG
jgi:hypothetical protein